MHPLNGWTGGTACALQAALRMSNDAFAAHLSVAPRTVAAWHQKPTTKPQSEMQQALDTVLDRASAAVRSRFEQLIGATPVEPVAVEPSLSEPVSDAELRLINDRNITQALDWLDERASREPGTSRRDVAARLGHVDVRDLRDLGARRGRVSQQDTVTALNAYYGTDADHGCYTARFGTRSVATSVLTRPSWLDLECPLIAEHDRLRPVPASPDGPPLDEEAAELAVQRITNALTIGTRVFNNPIYQVVGVDIDKHRIGGKVGITHFVEYALTTDLLEGELDEAIAAGQPTTPGQLPLRDLYLPDIPSVLDVGNRLCAGGALALTAIARPSDPFRGEADYLLLVQERSGNVLNAARRLAVIPKGFHQPINDIRADAQIGATLRREMEEELFGREDVDNTVSHARTADPMHHSRLSEPMRWLMSEPGRLRMECTGFGFNLVSGNYEFASLIVIEDEEFWTRYGGVVEANWETASLRQYSTTDDELLADLITDVAWSNEGLFAMMQGLRRLAEIGGHRVQLPPIDWEIRR